MANGFTRKLPFVNTANLRRIRASGEFLTKTPAGPTTVQAEEEAALSVEAQQRRLEQAEVSRIEESKRQADERLAESARQADISAEISRERIAEEKVQAERVAGEARKARKAAEPNFFTGLFGS